MICFDFDLVEKILLEENSKRKIVSADLYLEVDERFNNVTIIENGKFIKCHHSYCYSGSYWDSPKLRITYLIDNEEFDKDFFVGKWVSESEFDSECVETWIRNTEFYKKLGMELEVI